MSADKFYIIENDLVVNIGVFKEEDAQRLKLKRVPLVNEFGTVGIGWTYILKDDVFLPPPRDILAEWKAIRRTRDTLLGESDLYVLPDRWATYTQDEQYAWSQYRKALRDIPQNFIDPKEVVWPQKPWVESMESIKTSDPEI